MNDAPRDDAHVLTAPRPRWYRAAWFLGKAPALTERQWRVLGLVSVVSFFEQYDLYLFTLNLQQIQTSLHIEEGALGWLGSIVRAGALLAFIVTMAADRFGRRRVLMFTVLAYTSLTAATALAPTAQAFVVLQFLARIFAVAEVLLSIVVIVEEFPADQRGWGVGALAAISACGAGTAALLFGFVGVLPFGWRALYGIGVLPLLLIARWRRLLPETARFEAYAQQRPAVAGWWHQVRELLTTYGARFLTITSCNFLLSFGLAGVGFFQVKYLQNVHGWSPGWISALVVGGGGLAIVANPLAGRLSDRFGRRRLTVLFALLTAISAVLFYSVHGIWVPLLWIVFLFSQFGADTTLSTYAAELFPTSLRSTAGGMRSFISTLGGITGLAVVALLYRVLGSNWAAVSTLAGTCALVPLIVLFAFRETAGLTLEEIAPEPGMR